MNPILAFNKWSTEGISIKDPGLVRYITLTSQFVPKTGARYAAHRFHKSKIFILERLMNKLMIPGHRAKKHTKSSGHCTGGTVRVYETVKKMLEIIEKKTNKNPIEIFIKALENAAPREEAVAIEYGGARYTKAVECAPQRRVDVALRNFIQGAYDRSFNKKTNIESALAEEVLAAYRLDQKSTAISKKNEMERQADASR